MSNKFTPEMAQSIASRRGIPSAHVWAVVQTEANGVFSWGGGKIPILVERHKVYKYLKKERGYWFARKVYKRAPDICNPYSGGYGKYRNQYKRLAKAIKYCGAEVAHLGTSFGAFQIMGFNHKDAGFNSAVELSDAMHSGGAEGQIEIWLTFLSNYRKGKCLKALIEGDWVTFARTYNGMAYKINNYDVKMAQASFYYKRRYEGLEQKTLEEELIAIA